VGGKDDGVQWFAYFTQPHAEDEREKKNDSRGNKFRCNFHTRLPERMRFTQAKTRLRFEMP
jgi:hypothetical protein